MTASHGGRRGDRGGGLVRSDWTLSARAQARSCPSRTVAAPSQPECSLSHELP